MYKLLTGISMIIGILSSPVPGHMIPLAAFAEALINKGHEVYFFSILDTEQFLCEQGMKPIIYGRELFPKGSWEQRWGPLRSLYGNRAALKTSLIHRDIARAMCDEIPKLIKDLNIQFLIIDQVQFQGRAIAEVCDMAFCTVSCAFPMNLSKELPPPTQKGKPSTLFIRSAIYRFYRKIFRNVIINTNIAEAQKLLKDNGKSLYFEPEESYSKLLHIIPSIAECDFHQAWQNESHVQYTGAFVEECKNKSLKREKPLIYISFGTLQNENVKLLEKIAEGCRLAEADVIVGMGNWNHSQKLPNLSHTEILSMAPQQEILQRASLCITHGGFNTYNEALWAGVPLLVIPITNDQPGCASRIEALGYGKQLSRHKVSPKRISKEITSILNDSGILCRVSNVSKIQREAGGVKKAVRECQFALEKIR